MEPPVPQAQIRHAGAPGDACHGSRRQRPDWALATDATTLSHIPFGFVIGLQVLWSSFTFGIGLWRSVMPRCLTVWIALSDGVAFSCASLGLLVILPVTQGCVSHGSWTLRGKTVLKDGWGTPTRRTRRQVSRSGVTDRTYGSPTVDRLWALTRVAAAALSDRECCHADD
jgi:hypothetical protein